MEPLHDEEPYLDSSLPGFVEDGDRFDRPISRGRFTKAIRTVSAVVLAGMLVAAGTPLSWVSVVTAILMLLIWINIDRNDHGDTI